MRKWLKPGTIVLLLILTTVYLGNGIIKSQRKRAEKLEAKQVKMPQAQSEPVVPVDPSVAQPGTLVSTGHHVEYRERVIEPTVTPALPESTPDPVKQDVPFILCDEMPPTPTPTPTPVPKAAPIEPWLPRGVYIPFVLQGGLDSSHMDTPVQGVVTQDVYQHDYGIGQLIIHAGDRVSCFAARGYVRERVEVKGTWSLLFINTGLEVEFEGIACDQEFDPRSNQYGLYDKTAGLQGELIESDSYIRLKAAFGLLLQTASDSASTFASSALQTAMKGGTSVSYNVPSISPFTHEFIEQLINGHHTSINDTLFVRIKSGKPGYVFTTSVIYPTRASVGAKDQADAKARKAREQQSRGDQTVLDLQQMKQLIQTANQQGAATERYQNQPAEHDDENPDHSHFSQ